VSAESITSIATFLGVSVALTVALFSAWISARSAHRLKFFDLIVVDEYNKSDGFPKNYQRLLLSQQCWMTLSQQGMRLRFAPSFAFSFRDEGHVAREADGVALGRGAS